MPKTSGRSGKTTDTVSCGDKGACRSSVRRGRACSPPQIRSARRAWRRRDCRRIGRTHRPARRICAVCRGILPARLADGSCGFLQKMNMIEIRKGRADGRSALPFRIGQLNIAEKLHGCRRRLRRRSFFCLRRFSPPAISSCTASYAGACAFARSGMPCLRPAPALFPPIVKISKSVYLPCKNW